MTKVKIGLIVLVGVLTLLGLTPGLEAKTPDGSPPSEETVCDGLAGSLFGLCNAYCEAMDCTDPEQRASIRGCERVRANYLARSGGEPIPCEATCPCFTTADIDAAIDDQGVVACEDNGTVSVSQGNESFLVSNAEGLFCINEGDDQTVANLTETDYLRCVEAIVNSDAFAACPD